MPTKKTKDQPLTEHERMKYEIAQELGLMDKVNELGWKGLTAKETGKIGGLMTKKKKEEAKKQAQS
jgi:hypothetical protein